MGGWTVCVWLGGFGAWEDTLNSRLRGNDSTPAWAGVCLGVAPGVKSGQAEHEWYEVLPAGVGGRPGGDKEL